MSPDGSDRAPRVVRLGEAMQDVFAASDATVPDFPER